MLSEIEYKVRNIINENISLQVPIEQIRLEDDLFNLGLDSVNAIKLIVGIEAEFGFEFDDVDLNADNVQTLIKIVTYIERRK